MANTKTPVQDSHITQRVPVKGNQKRTSNTRDYAALQGQRYVNCWPAIHESKTEEPLKILVKAPYRDSVTLNFPDTDVGISCFDFDTHLFAWKNKIYSLEPGGVVTLLDTNATAGTYLSMRKVIDFSGSGDIIVAGVFRAEDTKYYAYTYNKSTDTLALSAEILAEGTAEYYVTGYADSDYVLTEGEMAVSRSIFLDGYHVVAIKTVTQGNNYVYSSVAGDYTDFPITTDFFVPEIDPDDLVDIQKHKNMICVIGTQTIEFFFNGNIEIGSPFTRQEQLTIRLGATQNLSAHGGTVSIANGEDIFFIASSPNGGSAIYMIRDFQATKVSDDYVDFLLNNVNDTIGGTNISQARLGLIDVYGTINVGISFSAEDNTIVKTLVFNERDMCWWEWVASDSSGLVPDTVQVVSNVNGSPVFIRGNFLGLNNFGIYSIGGQSDDGAGNLTLYYMSKNPNAGTRVAEMYTDVIDFDVNNWKHLAYVDAIGDYGDNSVELFFTKNPDYSNWRSLGKKFTTSPETDQAMRWYNPGQARRFAFRKRFIGTSDIAHRGLDVTFNIRTH